jgi:hypothetical protein
VEKVQLFKKRGGGEYVDAPKYIYIYIKASKMKNIQQQVFAGGHPPNY